jgi:hypothetical protein
MQHLGATAIVLMNISGADPHGTLRVYASRSFPRCAADQGTGVVMSPWIWAAVSALL